MFQETTTWDLRDMHPAPSAGFNFYVLFLFVACVVAGAKLLKAWRVARPFRSARQADNPAYLESLNAASISLKHWIGCIFLVWGLYASMHLYEVCSGLYVSKSVGNSAILLVIQDFSTGFTMTCMVALFLFLVRWHMVKRVQKYCAGAVRKEGMKGE